MKRIAIIGGGGYTSSELLRLLVGHPHFEVVRITSRSNSGRRVSEVHPFLESLIDLSFEENEPSLVTRDVDLVFLALPHGVTASFVKAIGPTEVPLVDLSGDFRLNDPSIHKHTYPETPLLSDLRNEFVYGLPELFRDRIRKARNVACPGCFATGAILALAPFADAGLITGSPIVDGKTGSSGSGASASSTTHHPERVERFSAYGALTHRHGPEIHQALNELQSDLKPITFVPHSTPMVRGIYTTAYIDNRTHKLSPEATRDKIADFYQNETFIRLRPSPSDCGVVARTNFADLWATSNNEVIVVTSAIDNLVKGAAGQAIQVANLIFDLPETSGLLFPGTRP